MKHMFLSESRPYRIDNEKDLIDAIQTGKIKNYTKFPMLKKGDWVTCCKLKNSLLSGFKRLEKLGAAGYKEGLTFKITELRIFGTEVIAMGAVGGNGVYMEHLRFATEEEIKNFKNI